MGNFYKLSILYRTEDGPLPGCITDRLGDGAELTIPVMASYCSRSVGWRTLEIRQLLNQKCSQHQGHISYMNSRHCYLHHKRDQLSRVHRCPKEGVIHHEIDAATLPKVDWSNKLLLFTAQLCKSPLNSRLLQAGFNPTNIKSTLFVDNANVKKIIIRKMT